MGASNYWGPAGIPDSGRGLCKSQELSEDLAALGRVESRMVSWDKTSLSLECQGEVLASLSPTP